MESKKALVVGKGYMSLHYVPQPLVSEGWMNRDSERAWTVDELHLRKLGKSRLISWDPAIKIARFGDRRPFAHGLHKAYSCRSIDRKGDGLMYVDVRLIF
jgi:hypothetical protein